MSLFSSSSSFTENFFAFSFKKTENKINNKSSFKIKERILQDPVLTVLVVIAFIIFYLSVIFLSGNGIISNGRRLSEYEVGKVAERELIADRDVEYEDKKATALKQEAQELLVEPVFRVTESITSRVIETVNEFVVIYKKLLVEKALLTVSSIYLEIQSALPGYFSEEQIKLLLKVEAPENLLKEYQKLIKTIMENGIVSFPENLKITVGSIDVIKWIDGEKVSEITPIDNVMTIKNVIEKSSTFYNYDSLTKDERAFIEILLLNFLKENTFFDSEQTSFKKKRARDQVQPVVKKLVKNEVIVKKGFLVSSEDMVKVKALGTFTDSKNYSILLGKLIILLFIFIVGFYIFKPPVLVKTPARHYLYTIIIMFIIYILTAILLKRYLKTNEFLPVSIFIPTALITMLVSIMVNVATGVVSSVILSLCLLIIPGAQLFNITFAFISGFFGSLVVKNTEHRIHLIKAGLIISLINIVTVFALCLINNTDFNNITIIIVFALANGFLCGIFTLGLLPILEHALNAPTPFRLMELSDLNTPLFKRMLILAPGTYSHSVSVANLAETAAKEIGANHLLARVGAYYHDIGKIDQAEYFIENQRAGNKHDELKASLSTAVIKSHVKIGYEKARELGLPEEVMQIILQHHGSGKISYFYMKALKEQKQTQKLQPEDFSYTGTPPSTREAAVVMLADTVEAACRTLKNPTISKLERFIWELIIEKVTSGQMKNSNLTFNDLETIKKLFVQIIGGSFHNRIEYPNQNENKASE